MVSLAFEKVPKSHCILIPHYFGYMSLGSEMDSWSPRGRNLLAEGHAWDLIFNPDLHPLLAPSHFHRVKASDTGVWEALHCGYIKPLCVRLMPDDIPCVSDEMNLAMTKIINISSQAASIVCDLCALPLSKTTASNEPGVNASYSFRFRFTLYFVPEHHIVFFTLPFLLSTLGHVDLSWH